MRFPFAARSLMAALFLLGLPFAAAAQPVKIRNAYVVPVSNWAPLLEVKKDLARNWGKTYVMESVRFQGTPPMITALANNELEIANLAFSTLGLAIQNARLDDLRVVADEFQDGVEGYFTNEFYVRPDSGINSIKDLKGKVLAINSIGSGVDIAMKAALAREGFQDKRDYTVIEAPFPTMASLLKEKKVDMVAAVLPFALNPELRANKILFTQREAIGPSQFVFWTMRKSFIDKNRAAVVDFMEDVIRIQRWYLDPQNHEEVKKIASDLLKAPPDRFDWVFTKKDYFRDPGAVPNIDALQKNADVTAELGFIRAKLDVKTYSDLSIVEEAAKRIK